MTNREYLMENYQKELAEIALNLDKLAIVDGVPKICSEVQCTDCMFNMFTAGALCENRIQEWLDKEHITYEVDWTKVPVDTPVFVDKLSKIGFRRHFAKYENGRIYVFGGGRTSYTTVLSDVEDYSVVRLAEPHPEWMKEV